MARWKTLPYVFFCSETWWIIKAMDCNKKMQEKAKTWFKFFSKFVKRYVIAKWKQHKHSSWN